MFRDEDLLDRIKEGEDNLKTSKKNETKALNGFKSSIDRSSIGSTRLGGKFRIGSLSPHLLSFTLLVSLGFVTWNVIWKESYEEEYSLTTDTLNILHQIIRSQMEDSISSFSLVCLFMGAAIESDPDMGFAQWGSLAELYNQQYQLSTAHYSFAKVVYNDTRRQEEEALTADLQYWYKTHLDIMDIFDQDTYPHLLTDTHYDHERIEVGLLDQDLSFQVANDTNKLNVITRVGTVDINTTDGGYTANPLIGSILDPIEGYEALTNATIRGEIVCGAPVDLQPLVHGLMELCLTPVYNITSYAPDHIQRTIETTDPLGYVVAVLRTDSILRAVFTTAGSLAGTSYYLFDKSCVDEEGSVCVCTLLNAGATTKKMGTVLLDVSDPDLTYDDIIQSAEERVESEFIIGNRTWLLVTVAEAYFYRNVTEEPLRITFIVGAVSLCLVLASTATLTFVGSHHSYLQQQERNAADARSYMLSFVCHEIRNPLHASGAIIEAMRHEGLVTKDIAADIDSLELTVLSMFTLVNDVLDADKMQRTDSSMLFLKEPIKLRGFVEKLIVQYARLASVPISSEIQPSVPSTILGDRRRMEQVLTNGLTNAIKYTDEGYIKIRIRQPKRLYHHKSMLLFEVIDSGEGFQEESVTSLFEEFVSNDRPNWTAAKFSRVKSSGLGLNICKKIVEAAGGRIGLTNNTKGCIFWFMWPLETAETLRKARQVSMLSISDSSTTDSLAIPSRKVVPMCEEDSQLTVRDDSLFDIDVYVVDDERMNRRVLVRMLRRIGWTSQRIKSLADGVNLISAYSDSFHSQRPERVVILLDILMKQSCGDEVAQYLRDQGWKGVMIACTGNADKERTNGYLQSGFDAILTKPFKIEALKKKLFQTYQKKFNIKLTELNSPREDEKETV